MATAARLAIAARRNEVARFTIAVDGIDLTGVNMAMQIRLAPDTPGAPLLALGTVTTLAAEGLKLDSVTVVDGIPTSIIRGRINASTMTDATKMPYSGEVGTDTVLAYAMQWTLGGDAQTRLHGIFIVVASAFNSDNAPVNRPIGYGGSSGNSSVGTSSTLTFGDEIIRVSLDGFDLLAPLIQQAVLAAEQAMAAAALVPVNVQAQLDTLDQSKATKAALQDEFDGRVFADAQIYYNVAFKNAEQDALIDQALAQASIASESHDPVFDPHAPVPMAPSFVNVSGLAAPRFDKEIELFGMGGQSTIGGATVGPAEATASLFPGRALTTGDMGVRVTAGWRFESFADAVETYNPASHEGETAVTSFLSHYLQANDAIPGAARRKVVALVSAVGGTAFADLRRGSFSYQNYLDAVEDAWRVANEAGYNLRVAGNFWGQGQNETGNNTTEDQYFNMLRTYARQIGDDVMKITGQHERPMLYIMQASTVNNARGLDQPIQRAQLRAGRTDWARLVGTMYPYPTAAETGAETIHQNGRGTNLMGQVMARAAFAESYGLGWSPFALRAARFLSPTEILAQFDVPTAPIVIDETGGVINPAGLQGRYGIDVQRPDGSYAAIGNGEVVNGTDIKFTLSAPINVPWVTLGVGLRRNVNTSDDGPVKGPRTCIRDSATGANLWGLGTPANWLCHDAVRVPALGSF